MTRLVAVLLAVEFLDELVSGIPPLASPELQANFQVSYGQAAGWLVFAFGLGALAETPVLLFSEGRDRRRFVRGGLLAVAAVSFGAASAPSYPVLFAALALWGLASGVGVSLSQATLMDAHPEQRERALTRWVFLGALGDLATPALLAGLAALTLGWRSGFGAGGVLFVIAALALPRTFPRAAGDPRGEEGAPLRAALRDASAAPRLWLWLAGAMLCSLLDEVFLAFGALYLRDRLSADLAARSLVFTCFMAASLPGLALQERLLSRVTGRTLLAVEAALTALFLVAWIEAPSLLWSAIFATALGACVPGLYALAKARAFAALPARSATVVALSSLFGWLDLLLPAGLALVADAFGLRVTLWLLLAQPLGLLLIAALDRRSAPTGPGDSLSP
jgi:FSR family fosmidomycin resistance protein-like MFS transporter